MPKFDFFIIKGTSKTLFSFEIGHEGIFLFITPLHLAMLWPWVKN